MTFVPDTLSATLKAQRGKGGGGIGPEETLVAARTLTKGERYDGDDWSPELGRTSISMGVAISENQRGEVLETDYAHQLTSGGGKPGQGYAAARTEAGVRRLTPVECERLQGLPDGWTQVPDTAPDSRRYAALGDAVTANVAEWIGRRLLAHVVAEAARRL